MPKIKTKILLKNEYNDGSYDQNENPNYALNELLRIKFEPLGIVAYSKCCRWGCTGSYAGDGEEPRDPSFRPRKKGIYYFRFHTDGMNYYSKPDECYVYYWSFKYIMEHWDEEIIFIHDWSSILNMNMDDYSIVKPTWNDEPIIVKFTRPYQLDEVK